MFEVELDVFSGRPNPRWVLEPEDEAELFERLLDRTVPMAPTTIGDRRLGYRGFVVRANGSTAVALTAHGLPVVFRVRDGLGTSIDAGAERWLLFTGDGSNLQAPARQSAERELTTAAACKRPHRTSSTNFRDWNRGLISYQNNCYNYGSNWRTDTYAQPGRGSGTGLADITIPEVLRCAESDGYVDHCVGKKDRNIRVWFCVWPEVDYHWYRQTTPMDGDERWCHKMGTAPAGNKDDAGQFITDPRLADRGPYTEEGVFLFYGRRSNKTVV